MVVLDLVVRDVTNTTLGLLSASVWARGESDLPTAMPGL